MHKLDKLCQLGNIINFEYSENFPNSGFTSLIFPIGKALGPLPKIAKKIPGKPTFPKLNLPKKGQGPPRVCI